MAASPAGSLWLDTSLDLSDEKNPIKFSSGKKARVVAAGIAITINSALGSSLPSGGASDIAKAFSVTDPLQLVLLNSIYMLGFAIGPPIFGPLSEHVGRRLVLISTYVGYMLSTLCCAVSPNYAALLLFRLLCGIAAAAPNAVVGPLYADIYDHPEPRGRSMAYFMCATSMTPPFGPIISGYATRHSWRLTFWIGLGIAAAFLPLVLCLPETFAPVIRRKWMQHSTDQEGFDYLASSENQRWALVQELKVVFSRPFIMILREPVVLFSSLYLALVYATLYLFFQAYPIIFRGVYGLSYGEVGLTFLPVTAGSSLALAVFLWYSSCHASAMKAGASWAKNIEYRRLPPACAGGPAYVALGDIPMTIRETDTSSSIVISLFWLGWTPYTAIYPAVPALSGVLFGVGYLVIFMALLNYVTDAYRQFSASAQAAASTTRSITAVCLPLAAPQMYEKLGIQWACSLLAFITLALAFIPLIFIRYGEDLRRRSPFCQKLSNSANIVAMT
ncbi:hypothetical protein DL766_003481 [Monosporascus sp. MC13-8B]|uniref:Major facilitator superfamily (MFS) profile domain-containing protein n=1 Tax=Monosporascus cannonballus TaxID=155416 RepID=A0ABY0HHF0_9PEZI|nr:hypothetical protein DL763_011565 [Monosporascus cannonballus]RYO91524.1 hypothetical protein DL762_002138 [Monosporascus cannonballus]RYP33418.1 hypothetical protein DL766_003481 [Monosporascus sp. MC13-8B]